MELLELKKTWDLVAAEAIRIHRVDENIIQKSLEEKSNSHIAQIKRTLKLKVILGSAACAIVSTFAMGLLINPGEFNIVSSYFSPVEAAVFFGTLALSVLIMVTYNFRALKKINEIQSASPNLKYSLKSVIGIMQKVMMLNIYSDAFMTPIVATWVVYAKIVSEVEFNWNKHGIILILVPVFIFLFSYFFQRYMQKMRFGKYVEQLKSHVRELE